MLENATLPEIAWTLLGLVGSLVAARATRAAFGDLAYVRRLGRNGVLKAVALNACWNEGKTLVIQLAFVVAGVVAMLTPNALRESVELHMRVIAGAFLLAEVLLVMNTVRYLVYRQQLASLITRQRKHKERLT